MSPADELLELMNTVSEDDFAAGWRIDLEYILWRRVLSARADDRTQALRRLASAAGGWWAWLPGGEGRSEGRKFVSLVDWCTIFNASPKCNIRADREVLDFAPPPERATESAPDRPAGGLVSDDLVTRLRMASDAVKQPEGSLLESAAHAEHELKAEVRYATKAAQAPDGVSVVSAINGLKQAHAEHERRLRTEARDLREELAMCRSALTTAVDDNANHDSYRSQRRRHMAMLRAALALPPAMRHPAGPEFTPAAGVADQDLAPGRAALLDGNTLVEVGERSGDKVWIHGSEHYPVDPSRLTLLIDATPDMLAEVRRRQGEAAQAAIARRAVAARRLQAPREGRDVSGSNLVRSYVDEIIRASQLDENGRIPRAATEALARAETIKASMTPAQLDEAAKALYAVRQDRQQ